LREKGTRGPASIQGDCTSGYAPLQQSGSPLSNSISSTGWSEIRNTHVYFLDFEFYLWKLMSTVKLSSVDLLSEWEDA
jgi:hypothetical protein